MGLKVKRTSAQADDFSVWKTINIQTKPSYDELRSATVGFLGQGLELYKRTSELPQPTELDLVFLRISDLGFDGEVSYRRVCTAAKKRGLELCPALVGPALRMTYMDQPRGQWLYIAMEGLWLPPVEEEDEDLDDVPAEEYEPEPTVELFAVVCGGDGKLWLHSSLSNARRMRHPGDRFVFVKPRK